MTLLGFASRLLARASHAVRLADRALDGQQVSTRTRFGVSKSNRLNRDAWSGASDDGITVAQEAEQTEVRQRAHYEASNNPFLDGAIFTHAVDIVGPRGPKLVVNAGTTQAAKRYAAQVEGVCERWMEDPDHNGQDDLAAKLQQWVRAEWLDGEYLEQKTTGDPNPDGVTLKLLGIDSRRLDYPQTFTEDGDRVRFGVRIDSTGRRISYLVSPTLDGNSYAATDYEEVPAADMVHGYMTQEERFQVRGVPRVASGLDTQNELRRYERHVISAAKQAADGGWVLETENPESTPDEILAGSTMPIEPGQITYLPPGVSARQMKAEQPTQRYEEFVHHKLRGLGRAVAMPLTAILLDAGNLSFSHAKMIFGPYYRSIDLIRARYEKQLRQLLRQVVLEATLARTLPAAPASAAVVRFTFIWPAHPSPDPVKQAQADRMRLQDGVTSPRRVAASLDNNLAEVQAEASEDYAAMANTGPGLPAWTGIAPDDGDDDDNDEPGTQPGGDNTSAGDRELAAALRERQQLNGTAP